MKTKLTISLIAILLIANQLQAQKTVTGRVIDDTGSELPGVSVLVKGTTVGTMTLVNGTYSIEVPVGSETLIFSYIGMETLEEKINGRNVIDVSLKPSSAGIEEVVVTATGISKINRPISYCVQTIGGINKKRKNKKFNAGAANNVIIRGNTGLENPKSHNTEEYDCISENGYKDTKENPLSTLSIDVDNASYSNVRRFLNAGQLPPKDAVRIEEMINYFTYDYPEPQGEHPFSFITEYSDCPWNKENKLLHVGIQGKRLDYNDLKPSNFVFLIDVSGSMSSGNKLPLLKKSLLKLIDNMGRKDYVSIVVYAGAAGLVLPPTPAYNKDVIRKALNKLNAGGSTAGGAGIKLAYKIAKKVYIENGNNRVILATDGDFNVGTSSTGALVNLIEEKRKDDIYLTILGFGMGNYKDGRMEQISNAGNGNYFYIDNIKEAEKVFGKEMRANMFTIAKDVKIQIEFNPANVKAYRLIGYENRILNKEDFDDDAKDAGELGPGHTVTAIYEIIPYDSDTKVNKSDELKYQQAAILSSEFNDELMTLKFRYKPPKEEKSILIEHIVKNLSADIKKTTDNFRFSAAVAGFGMLLRDSQFKGNLKFKQILKLASESKGKDENAYRKEFISLIKKAEQIKNDLAEK
ncbi:MAG: von Willebrand factor type A domain-containing protein [Bacteroidales bacterium]|nr:von Willebrand factor type A domain-containing protein [Bacteroidales bacterium]